MFAEKCLLVFGCRLPRRHHSDARVFHHGLDLRLTSCSRIDEVEEEDEDEWDRAGDSDGEKSFVTAAEGGTSDGWSTSDGDGHRADELPRLR